MSRLSPARAVEWLATSRWRAAVLLGVVLLSTAALFSIDALFARRTGLPTPDTRNTLTLEEAIAQLSAWDDGSRLLYVGFAAVDFVFPLSVALFYAVVAHWLIVLGNRRPGPTVPAWVALVCLLPAAFDYVENAGFLAALGTGDPQWIRLALVGKALKLATLGVPAGLVAVLAVLLAVRTAVARRRRHRSG